MNVFVLTTGRSGSKTLAAALSHLPEPWTVGHESRSVRHIDRLEYPNDHVEIDNRLTWMLGSLHRRFPDTRYVQLWRRPDKVAASYNRRWGVTGGIMPAFDSGILLRHHYTRHVRRRVDDGEATARLMVDTMNDNITTFLADRQADQRTRNNVFPPINIDDPKDQFVNLWEHLVASHDGVDEALAEFDVVRDKTGTP